MWTALKNAYNKLKFAEKFPNSLIENKEINSLQKVKIQKLEGTLMQI